MTFARKFYEYLGLTWFIHIFMWIALTPWFFTQLNYSWDQYVTWMYQAPIISLMINYPLGKAIEWFLPRWNRLLKSDVKNGI